MLHVKHKMLHLYLSLVLSNALCLSAHLQYELREHVKSKARKVLYKGQFFMHLANIF